MNAATVGHVPDLGGHLRVHVVAVGGAAMSAVASILAAMGHDVSGSDQSDSAVLDRLRAEGIRVTVGHDAALVDGADLVTVSTAVKAGNPELEAALARSIPVATRPDMMEAIGRLKRTIAVSGTHGKTTTSAMVTLILREAGWDPSFIVGGTVHQLGTGVAWRPSTWFSVEADESDGSFLRFGAEAVIVTSIEEDHLDYWLTMDRLEAAFDRFVEQGSGPAVVCVDYERVRALIARVSPRRAGIVTYGIDRGADYRVERFAPAGIGSRFDVVHEGSVLASIEIAAPGIHNALNATAALAMAHRLGVPVDAAVTALRSFRGVARRFELRGRANGITFVDDYAHLPTKVSSVVSAAAALKATAGWTRLVAVFQPHRYTRTQALAQQFGASFDGADHVVVTGVYPAGQPPIAGVTGALVADAIRAQRPSAAVTYIEDRGELETWLVDELRPGDLCLTMSAGDLTTIPDVLLRGCRARAIEKAGEELRRRLGDRVRSGASLAELTMFKIGGPASLLVQVDAVDELDAVADAVAATQVPFLVIGRGSNLLVADVGVDGVVVVLGGDFEGIEIDHGVVRAGGAVRLPILARRTVAAGLTGLEWAVGVPGSVGGGVRMNAGGHGSDVAASLEWAEVLRVNEPDPTRRRRRLSNTELAFRYRGSSIGPDDLVIEAQFRLAAGDPETGARELEEITRWRREHQPGGNNCGSVFTNPPGDAAGRLIEQVGAKGMRIGGASVSPKHANFIQADPGATASDVVELIAQVRTKVAERFGVWLRPEVQMVGFDDATLELVGVAAPGGNP